MPMEYHCVVIKTLTTFGFPSTRPLFRGKSALQSSNTASFPGNFLRHFKSNDFHFHHYATSIHSECSFKFRLFQLFPKANYWFSSHACVSTTGTSFSLPAFKKKISVARTHFHWCIPSCFSYVDTAFIRTKDLLLTLPWVHSPSLIFSSSMSFLGQCSGRNRTECIGSCYGASCEWSNPTFTTSFQSSTSLEGSRSRCCQCQAYYAGWFYIVDMVLVCKGGPPYVSSISLRSVALISLFFHRCICSMVACDFPLKTLYTLKVSMVTTILLSC